MTWKCTFTTAFGVGCFVSANHLRAASVLASSALVRSSTFVPQTSSVKTGAVSGGVNGAATASDTEPLDLKLIDIVPTETIISTSKSILCICHLLFAAVLR